MGWNDPEPIGGNGGGGGNGDIPIKGPKKGSKLDKILERGRAKEKAARQKAERDKKDKGNGKK